MDLIDEEKKVDRLAYIVLNNPTGVQKVLYQYGFPAAESTDNLYELATKMLSMYPDSNPKLYGVHPDKEYIVDLFGKGSKFSVCNLCKSNFTQTQAESYSKEWAAKGSDAIKNEYERLRVEYNEVRSVNNPDAEEQRGEIASKQAILLNLLGQDSLSVSGGQSGQATSVSSGGGGSSATTSSSASTSSMFQSLNPTQKFLGIAAVLALGVLAIHHFAKS